MGRDLLPRPDRNRSRRPSGRLGLGLALAILLSSATTAFAGDIDEPDDDPGIAAGIGSILQWIATRPVLQLDRTQIISDTDSAEISGQTRGEQVTLSIEGRPVGLSNDGRFSVAWPMPKPGSAQTVQLVLRDGRGRSDSGSVQLVRPAPPDREPPSLALPLEIRAEGAPVALLEGEARDNVGIAQVTVDGVRVALTPLDAAATRVAFRQVLEVETDRLVVVEAVDPSGNVAAGRVRLSHVPPSLGTDPAPPIPTGTTPSEPKPEEFSPPETAFRPACGPDLEPSPVLVRRVQERLTAAGYATGRADGLAGAQTCGAIDAALDGLGHTGLRWDWSGLISILNEELRMLPPPQEESALPPPMTPPTPRVRETELPPPMTPPSRPAPEPEISLAPEPEISLAPEPEASLAPEPEVALDPEPEASLALEPEASLALEPEVSLEPEPEVSLAPEPVASPPLETATPSKPPVAQDQVDQPWHWLLPTVLVALVAVLLVLLAILLLLARALRDRKGRAQGGGTVIVRGLAGSAGDPRMTAPPALTLSLRVDSRRAGVPNVHELRRAA